METVSRCLEVIRNLYGCSGPWDGHLKCPQSTRPIYYTTVLQYNNRVVSCASVFLLSKSALLSHCRSDCHCRATRQQTNQQASTILLLLWDSNRLKPVSGTIDQYGATDQKVESGRALEKPTHSLLSSVLPSSACDEPSRCRAAPPFAFPLWASSRSRHPLRRLTKPLSVPLPSASVLPCATNTGRSLLTTSRGTARTAQRALAAASDHRPHRVLPLHPVRQGRRTTAHTLRTGLDNPPRLELDSALRPGLEPDLGSHLQETHILCVFRSPSSRSWPN